MKMPMNMAQFEQYDTGIDKKAGVKESPTEDRGDMKLKAAMAKRKKMQKMKGMK